MTAAERQASVLDGASRKSPFSEAFKEFIVEDWAPYDEQLPDALPSSAWTMARREAASERFPDKTLVVPAGAYRVRSNDTDHRFRPHTAFAWLSGLGQESEPDAVLVLFGDHPATLFFRPRCPRTDEEFYASSRYGEMWVGQRDSLEEMSARLQLPCRDIRDLEESLRGRDLLVMRDVDAAVTAMVDGLRDGDHAEADGVLATTLSEMRLVKDQFEIDEMRRACDATRVGFEAVARELPNAVLKGRGERWVEGVFGLHARHLGNTVGYDTIAAGGDHANTLHWIRNDGDLSGDDVILLDAGVEVDSLYTADVTRTLPVGGRFTPEQRRVYDVVLAAQTAGIEACRPGAPFTDPHTAAITVLADFFEELGMLPGTAAEALSEEGGQWRRWMVHGTSHHLGMDVHDCAEARREVYRGGTLAEGMIITVEPGIYFKSTDLLVPEKYRGIGVRIEDDILITDGDPENLSASLPRDADEVEAWLAEQQAR